MTTSIVHLAGRLPYSEKWEPLEDAEGAVLQDPRDRAKAELLESQSPAVKTHTRCYSVSNAASPGADRSRLRTATSDRESDG